MSTTVVLTPVVHYSLHINQNIMSIQAEGNRAIASKIAGFVVISRVISHLMADFALQVEHHAALWPKFRCDCPAEGKAHA